jgi:predicted SprT family Zn-dependent metalloprotease
MRIIDAINLANELLAEYELQAEGWRVTIDKQKIRAGVCRYGPKTIGLSAYLIRLNEESEVRNTILHEIAHALTPGAGHGPIWQAKALEIGARPDRCYTRDEMEMPVGNWKATCDACGEDLFREKKPKGRSHYHNRPQCYKPGVSEWPLIFRST